MDKARNKSKRFIPRIELTAEMQDRLRALRHKVPETARTSGLPYLLVYNIVHGRVRSISLNNYRKLFREDPPHRGARKVDGAFFRKMVRLWLFLNDDTTLADLYRDFFGAHHTKRIDYRIFTGQVRTVSSRLEQTMLEKFTETGLTKREVERWIGEFESWEEPDRVAYERIRPILIYLRDELKMNPTAVLNQSFARYESGDLQSVSRATYDRALAFKHRAEKAIASQRGYEMDKLRERLYRGRTGYTLYSKIEEELHFLRKFARKSVVQYLGRGVRHYETGKSKRIASWRAERIMDDCDAFIRQTPNLPLASLPRSQRNKWIGYLILSLSACIGHRLSTEEGRSLEKRILKPSHGQADYNKPQYGFTKFEMASRRLGMKKKAFDLMVSSNCEIFRHIGKYNNRWYLPNLYLKELSTKEYFNYITIKYEMLARRMNRSSPINECLN